MHRIKWKWYLSGHLIVLTFLLQHLQLPRRFDPSGTWLSSRCLTLVITRELAFPSWYNPLLQSLSEWNLQIIVCKMWLEFATKRKINFFLCLLFQRPAQHFSLHKFKVVIGHWPMILCFKVMDYWGQPLLLGQISLPLAICWLHPVCSKPINGSMPIPHS